MSAGGGGKGSSTSVKDAIAAFERNTGVAAEEAERVELYGQCPPIEKLDNSLAQLKSCKHLALSTNAIHSLTGLPTLESVTTLSIGRNLISKLDGVDALSSSLEQLWASYNNLGSLAGIEKLTSLKVLFVSNNKLNSWKEIDRLKSLSSSLEDLLLVGNPIYDHHAKADSTLHPSTRGSPYRQEVLKRLPRLRRLDGFDVNSVEGDILPEGTNTLPEGE
jgi:dynein light chain 1